MGDELLIILIIYFLLLIPLLLMLKWYVHVGKMLIIYILIYIIIFKLVQVCIPCVLLNILLLLLIIVLVPLLMEENFLVVVQSDTSKRENIIWKHYLRVTFVFWNPLLYKLSCLCYRLQLTIIFKVPLYVNVRLFPPVEVQVYCLVRQYDFICKI